MNISVEGLKAMRSSLEMQYYSLETEINLLYSKKKEDLVPEKVATQDLIDKQLTLLDNIICNLENTPKLYSELMQINRKYKQVMGD